MNCASSCSARTATSASWPSVNEWLVFPACHPCRNQRNTAAGFRWRASWARCARIATWPARRRSSCRRLVRVLMWSNWYQLKPGAVGARVGSAADPGRAGRDAAAAGGAATPAGATAQTGHFGSASEGQLGSAALAACNAGAWGPPTWAAAVKARSCQLISAWSLDITGFYRQANQQLRDEGDVMRVGLRNFPVQTHLQLLVLGTAHVTWLWQRVASQERVGDRRLPRHRRAYAEHRVSSRISNRLNTLWSTCS